MRIEKMFDSRVVPTPIFYPISEPRLHKLERDIGFPLPESFRHFLLEFNGAEFLDYVVWPVPGGGENEGRFVTRIYGFAPNPIEGDLRAQQNEYFLQKWLHDLNVLCFAEGPSSQFLFDTSGTVYEWMTRTYPPDNEEERMLDRDAYLEQICSSFLEFCSQLRRHKEN